MARVPHRRLGAHGRLAAPPAAVRDAPLRGALRSLGAVRLVAHAGGGDPRGAVRNRRAREVGYWRRVVRRRRVGEEGHRARGGMRHHARRGKVRVVTPGGRGVHVVPRRLDMRMGNGMGMRRRVVVVGGLRREVRRRRVRAVEPQRRRLGLGARALGLGGGRTRPRNTRLARACLRRRPVPPRGTGSLVLVGAGRRALLLPVLLVRKVTDYGLLSGGVRVAQLVLVVLVLVVLVVAVVVVVVIGHRRAHRDCVVAHPPRELLLPQRQSRRHLVRLHLRHHVVGDFKLLRMMHEVKDMHSISVLCL
mmetsp:Transcript_3805/g.7410  ORF Transcript_3805/g.7410 Transcript_3805/m.7410 type:complete len:305 (-) Transcript_3805:108-1022(-)